jgi:ABC-type transport system involved in cytochrome c biogenesis permease subunit
MNLLKSYGTPLLILLVLALFGLYVLGSAVGTDVPSKKYDGFDFASLRLIPVVEGGRIKPLDTLARTTLRLNNASEVFEDADEKKYPAILWLMEAMSTDKELDNRKGLIWTSETFKIDNEQIRNVLALKGRSGLRYTLNEISNKFEMLQAEIDKARETPKDRRDLYQVKLLEFGDRLERFVRVNQLDIRAIPTPSQDADWESLADRRRKHSKAAARTADEKTMAQFSLNTVKFKDLPVEKQQEIDRWEKQARDEEYQRLVQQDSELGQWLDLTKAYRDKDPEKFNQIVADLSRATSELSPKQQQALKLEVFLNRFAPLFKCIVMYIAAAFLALVGLLLTGWSRDLSPPFRWASFALIGFTFAVHTFGLVARMYIQGRPPVTNLYSSAVFIGWGAVGLCMILEIIRPLGIANLVGSSLGFLTTVVAHNLGSESDTLEMMQAVLDTNFWLATHVTMVTFGYVATYVAGFLGILFILLGVCTPVLDRHAFKSLSGMIYGTVCFATLLSFVGTVLGGIWADYSWGRFWGWDPKENGALLIVMWNAIVLHARWAGLVKQRGVALLTILGNVVTTWSWFGTNMLGVGLHSYGFSSLRMWAIVVFLLAMAAVIAVGLAIPLRSWTSNGEQFRLREAI